jgi:hypothetical protein
MPFKRDLFCSKDDLGYESEDEMMGCVPFLDPVLEQPMEQDQEMGAGEARPLPQFLEGLSLDSPKQEQEKGRRRGSKSEQKKSQRKKEKAAELVAGSLSEPKKRKTGSKS